MLAVLDFAIYPVKTIGDLFLIEVLGCRVPLVFFGNILSFFLFLSGRQITSVKNR
jgi:hypothetical protein